MTSPAPRVCSAPRTGRLLSTPFTGGLIIGVGFLLATVLPRQFTRPASALAEMEPATAHRVAHALPGTQVLVTGFAAASPEPGAAPLLAYSEYGWQGHRWVALHEHHPGFGLYVPDGVVTIHEGYRLVTPPVGRARPFRRLEGIARSARVTAIGTVVAGDRPTVAADRVFGGTPREYVGSLVEAARWLQTAGMMVILLGGACFTVAVRGLLRRLPG